MASHDQVWDGNFWSDYTGWDVNGDGRGDVPYRSNTLVDALLWKLPLAKLLLASPAFQVLAFAEREFPVIRVPKGIDHAPLMAPAVPEWESILERYPPKPQRLNPNQHLSPLHLPRPRASRATWLYLPHQHRWGRSGSVRLRLPLPPRPQPAASPEN